MNDLYQGLFIASYDYGHGNELIPYLNQQMISVYAALALAVIFIWIISMGVTSYKNDPPRVFTKFGYMILAELVLTSLFGFSVWEISFAGIFAIASIVFGICCCILGEHIDHELEAEDERHKRFRRQRQIRQYIRERGKAR